LINPHRPAAEVAVEMRRCSGEWLSGAFSGRRLEILRRGLRHARKFLAPEQRHEAAFPFDQPATPKLRCGAVEVHKRKAASIRENLPSERKAKLIIAQKAYYQLRVLLPRNG
jgi:hypothetical protein